MLKMGAVFKSTDFKYHFNIKRAVIKESRWFEHSFTGCIDSVLRVQGRFSRYLACSLGPLDNQHRNPVDDRIHATADCAGQTRFLQRKRAETGWAGKLVQHRHGKFQLGCGFRRHNCSLKTEHCLLNRSVGPVRMAVQVALGPIGELLLNALIRAGAGELIGHANAVVDRIVIR